MNDEINKLLLEDDLDVNPNTIVINVEDLLK